MIGEAQAHPKILEIVVKTDQQTLSEIDLLGRYDEAQREGPQHEDADRNQRSDEDRFRIVLARILHIHHMNTHHLHSGIEKKDSGSQHQIVELGQVGKEPHALFMLLCPPEAR